MTINRAGIVVVLACVLAMAGCQSRLKQTRTAVVKAGESRQIYVDGPTYEQKVGIDFTASNPVSVYVCLKKDEGKVADAADRGQSAPGVLASAMKSTGQSLEVTVPKKEEFVLIFVGGTKDADLTVTIAGK